MIEIDAMAIRAGDVIRDSHDGKPDRRSIPVKRVDPCGNGKTHIHVNGDSCYHLLSKVFRVA